jgi:predicted DCC family thiol-disulfide oxidoreductase YuxK
VRPRAPARPRLLYDRDCGFCRWTLAWILRWDRRHRLDPVPISDPADLDSWHFERGGIRWSAGHAFAPLLEELPGGRPLAPLARRLQWLLVPGYRWVAAHRNGLSRMVPARSKARADRIVRSRAPQSDGNDGGAESIA